MTSSSRSLPAPETVAVVGAGLIGGSWAALFLAHGHTVRVYDAAEDAAERVRASVATAWPALERLCGALPGWEARLSVHATPAEAVTGATFVQESLPERLPIKHAVYAQIEPALAPGAVVSTSSSGLLLSDLQQGFADPSRLLLGHPYNPPHLIPLVELLVNERTGADVLATAEAFYAGVGKVTIRLNREVPGHVANRLQAALWREAIDLVVSGVASVADVDKAVVAGPGLRWAVMGPHQLFHLGGGEGGMAMFCERYRDSFHTWWDSMAAPRLSEDVCGQLIEGVREQAAGRSTAELAAERDRQILHVLTRPC